VLIVLMWCRCCCAVPELVDEMATIRDPSSGDGTQVRPDLWSLERNAPSNNKSG
jgi:hypothetical protein